MQIKINDLIDLPEAANTFLKITEGYKNFAFNAEMGAGKTTFINAILKEMGINDHSSSPTFSIVNEYDSPSFGAVYHFDFYRINNEIEAYDIGVEDILYDSNYCFIEWPEKIPNLLPENCVNINITVENNCRLIDVEI